MYAALSLDAIGTAWIAWTVLSALSVSKTTRTTILFRYHFLSLNLKFSSLLPDLFVWGREEKRNRLSWMRILCCSFSVSPYAPRVNNCVTYTKFSFFSLMCEFLMCFFSVWWQIRKSTNQEVIRVCDFQKILDLTGIKRGIINGDKVVFLRKHIKRKAQFIISEEDFTNKCEACWCRIPEPFFFCSLSCRVLHSHNFSQLFFFFFASLLLLFFFANALSLLIIDGGDPRISKRRRGTQLQWCQTRRTYTVVAAMDERRARFKEQNEERESPIVPQWDDPIGEAWGEVGGGA